MLTAVLLGASGPPPARRIDGRTMVAVEPLAKRLGIPVKHVNGALALEVDGTWVELHPNEITLREGATPVIRLTSFPAVRDGRLYIDAADLSSVFDVDATVRGSHVAVAKKQAGRTSEPGFSVAEVAAPHPTGKPEESPPPQSLSRRIAIGNVNAALFSYARQTNYNALIDGGGAHFHTTLYLSGMSGSRTNVGGTLRFGDAGRKYFAIGGVNDPLYGEIFTGGGANGIENVSAGGGFESYSTTTVDGRHVLAVGKRSGDWVREAALTDAGGKIQPLFGLQRWNETPKFAFDREIWAGLHGFGAGVRYRTAGRLYADTRLAFAGGGLPLVTGDALTQATLGYDVSPLFGIRAGYGIAHMQSGEAVLQIYGGPPGMNFSLSHYGTQNTATLDLSRMRAQLRVAYVRAPGYTALQSDGAFHALHGIVETRTYLASDSSDLAADYRFNPTAGVTLGLESVHAQSGGRIAPTLGYFIPVSGALSVGFEYHPLANGNGIRFTVAQSLYARPVPMRRTISVTMPDSGGTPVFLLIDGVRTQQLTGETTRVLVENGSHYLSLQTQDGRFGSPEQRVVDGTPTLVSLPLWPVTEVRGTLQITEMPPGMERPALEGITITLQPGGISTQTAADGTFAFPAQALDPQTRIAVEPDTLPKGLSAAPSALQPGEPVTILLHSSTKIEKVIF